jgi:hypothetical protein
MGEKGRRRLKLMRFVVIVRGEKQTVPVKAGVVGHKKWVLLIL